MGTSMSSSNKDLARPLKELERMWPTEVLAMGIESQAELADHMCVSGAANTDVCAGFLRKLQDVFPHEPPNNTTGVGNIAYLALFAVDPAHRAQFAIFHNAYTLLLKRKYGL
jgi:hypothetical protein